ncbi:unnamed protein product, partial [marine sediment metagenome]
MSKLTVILLLATIIALCALPKASAQRKFEFDVYTVFASNYRHGMGDDLLLVKSCLKQLPFSSYTRLNKKHFKLLLDRTAKIPIPGGSTLTVQPKVYYGKNAYIQVQLTGEDKGISFYDPKNSVSILSGPAFRI